LVNIIMDGSSSAPATAPVSAPTAPIVQTVPTSTLASSKSPIRTYKPSPAPVTVQPKAFPTTPVTAQIPKIAPVRNYQSTPVTVKAAAPTTTRPVPVRNYQPTSITTSVPRPVPVRNFQSTPITPVAIQAITPITQTQVTTNKKSSGLDKDKLTKDITGKLQTMLGLIDEEIDVTIPLRVYGLDSLTAMELTKWIESEMNIEFSQSELLGDDITTEDLVNIIMDGSSSAPATAPEPTAPAATLLNTAAPVSTYKPSPVTVRSAPVVAPITKVNTFQSTPIVPITQTRTSPIIAPVTQARNAPAAVTSAKPSSGLNKEKLTKDITGKLQTMLGLIDEEIDVTIPLRVYGLDSLTAMELTKWIESEMNIEFSQSELLGDDITTEDLVNIIMDGSSSAPATEPTVASPAPVAIPVTVSSPTPVVKNINAPVAPSTINVQTIEVQPNMDHDYQNIPAIQPLTPKVNSNANNEALKNLVCEKLQNILGLVDEDIDPAIPLRVYGLDSLTSMELTNWVQEELKVNIPQSQLLADEITTNELIRIISNLLSNNNSSNFYGTTSNNNSLEFNEVSKSKSVSSIADSESTFDPSLINQYDQAHETIMTDDLLRKGNVSSGNKKEIAKHLKSEVIEKLQDLLGLVDEEIDTNVPLQVYGLDSLTSMEIVKWVENDKKVELPQSALLSSEITTEELVNMIATKIAGVDPTKTPSYDQFIDNELLI